MENIATGNQKQYGGVVKAAVLLLMFVQMTVSVTTPGLGAVMKAFPGIDPMVVKQIATWPPLLLIFASLAVAPLTRVIRKKTVLLIASVLIFIGGIAPAFGGGMNFILGCRVVFGIGYGLIFPLCSSLIIDLFRGKERQTLMGYKSAVGAFAGVIFQTVGGLLAAMYWRYTFLGFLITIPFIIFAMWKIPEPEKIEVEAAAGSEKKIKQGMDKKTWLVIILTALSIMAFSSFMTNMAIVITAYDIGTPAHAGLVMTIFTGGMFFGSAFFAKTSQLFKRFTVAIPFILMGIALFALVSFNSVNMYMIIAFVFGIGFGTYNPLFTLKVAESAGAASTLAISIYASGQGVGQFLQPYFLKLATSVLGMSGEKAPWLVAAVIMGVASVVLIIVCAFNSDKKAKIAA